MVKNSKQNSKKSEKNYIEWWMYLPQIIALGYVPLLVHVYTYYRPILAEQVWFPDGYQVDFFLAYKAYGVIICAFFALIIFLATLPQFPFKKNKMYIPLGVYAIMVIISGTISSYRSLAWMGSSESFESVPVLLSYCIICVTTAHLISYDGMKGIKTIVYAALPGIFVLLLVGAFQYFGMDLFKTEIGEKLILGSLAGEMDLSFSFRDGMTYSTLYNPNFVGAYFSIITPFFICFSFIEENKWRRIILWIGTVLSFINIIGSENSTVWVVLFCELAFGIIVLGFSNRNIKQGIIIAAAMCMTGVLIVSGVMMTEIGRKKIDSFLVYNGSEFIKDREIHTSMEGIKYIHGDDSVLISYELKGNEVQIKCVDEAGTIIEPIYIKEEESYTIPLQYGSVTVEIKNTEEGEKYIYIKDDQLGYNFYKMENQYYVINGAGKLESFPENIKKSNVFPDGFSSGRGLIWNLTIPLLPRHIFLGSGAGTYVMEYPQSDYNFINVFTLDVKPHSFYLQQWVENGFIALIAILIFLVFVLFRSVKTNIGTKVTKDCMQQWIVILLSSLCIVGFLVSGIMNDSIIVYGIVFWNMIGMSIGVLLKDNDS